MKLDRIAFEGERGTGKSTALRALQSYFQEHGQVALVNRDVLAMKRTHPIHVEATELHQAWVKEFADGMSTEPFDVSKAEELSRRKFRCGLKILPWEEEQYVAAMVAHDASVMLCDRDVDTVVLYAAAEMILSNTQKYTTPESQLLLIAQLWEEVRLYRAAAPRTFCLTTANPRATLQRSHATKEATSEAFQITPLQEAIQELASTLLPSVVASSARISGKIDLLTVDGKGPEGIRRYIRNELFTSAVDLPRPLTYALPPLRILQGCEMPSTLSALIECAHASVAPAAFPSSSEVRKGFGNCFHANALLAEWISILKLGDAELVRLQRDPRTGTNPLHWMVLAEVPEGRFAVDVTPFSPPHIERLDALVDRGGILLPDDPGRVSMLQEHAHHATYSSDPAVRQQTKEQFEVTEEGTHRLYLGIRYLRLLARERAWEEYRTVVESLKSPPCNLVLAREIARNAPELGRACTPDDMLYLTQARDLVLRASKSMGQADREQFLAYYRPIIDITALP